MPPAQTPPPPLTPEERREALRILVDGGVTQPTPEQIEASGEVVRAVRAVALGAGLKAGRKGN